jgi:hypothetical protein
MIYKVYEPNMETLRQRLIRLNVKLSAIGCPAVTFAVVGHEDVPEEEDSNKLRRFLKVEVQGTVPTVNGWKFLATIDHTPEGNVFRSVPGFNVPAEYRDKAPCCDHCKVNRFRRDTYIVQHADGRTMQVGSNCLQDFLNYEHPNHLTKAAQILLSAYDIADAAQDEHWLGSTGKRVRDYYRISTRQFLGHVAAVVRVEGKFVTSKYANEHGGQATGRTAKQVMDRGSENFYAAYTPIEADFKLADAAVDWVIGKYGPTLGFEDGDDVSGLKAAVLNSLKGTNTQINDFEHNMYTVAKSEAIEPRLCGIAAYILEAYRRSMMTRPEVAQLNVNGLPRILAMFNTASAKLKHPAVRLASEDGHYMVLSLAGKASKNPGCIYVKGERGTDAYFGKITPEGKFFPVRTCPTGVEPQLKAFAENPEEVAAKYGKLTGCCSFCGRRLTDERSTEVGYGPVCAEKFGLKWGSSKAQPEAAPVDQIVVTA